jgi:hypothetical protein
MRFFSEYALYFVAMLVATIVFVKPITKSHWPLVAKVGFYVISGALFVCILLFEYFMKTSLTDIVRETVGNTVCHLYPLRACPKEVHDRVERERIERLRAQARARQREQMPSSEASERAPQVPEPLRPRPPVEHVTPAFPIPPGGAKRKVQ